MVKTETEKNTDQSKIEKIISNTDYINWIDNHTIKTKAVLFSNDYILYKGEYSKEEEEKIKSLTYFYKAINKYASKNSIIPTRTIEGMPIYKIKFGNKIFEIGILSKEKEICFCMRTDLIKYENYIDFYDIIYNRQHSYEDNIKDKMNELSNLVRALYKSGIPMRKIINTVTSTVDEVNMESRNKKLLKRNIES